MVTVAELAADPAAYEGQLLAVSGQYGQVPLVVCGTAPQVSPASWLLADGPGAILADGFENQLRPFLPIGLTVEVEGRWTRWQGMVGCGTESTLQEVWYLAAGRVISPNPISQVTLTPGGELAAGLGSPPDAATPGPTRTPAPAGTVVSNLPPGTVVVTTPIATGDAIETPIAGGIPTATPFIGAVATATMTPGLPPAVTPTVGGASLASATPTLGATAPAVGTATVTATGSAAVTATGTAAPGETPSVTPLPGTQGTITGAGGLDKGQLAAGETDRYAFPISAGTTLTVMVASSLDLDVAVSVVDFDSNVLAEQDREPAGEVEVLQGVELPVAGTYEILVSDIGGNGGYYTLMLLDGDSYTFVFLQTLDYGDQGSALMLPDNDHFWHFFGTAGDHISLLIEPEDLSDLFYEIYGIDATLLVSLTSEGSAGEAEILADFVLPATGFYSVRVGEMSFGLSAYTLSLEMTANR